MRNNKNISEDLIYKVLNQESNESEMKLFQDWIQQSSKNEEVFRHIEQLWHSSDKLGDYYKIDQDKAWKIINSQIIKTPKRRILQSVFKVAAIIVLAFMLGTITTYFLKTEPPAKVASNQTVKVKAPLGSKTIVELSDGTKVWLNSGSEVYYPEQFNNNHRDVYLTGEAYFDVAKNESLPFFVHTDNIDIRVVGTRFNVKSYAKEDVVETTLVEGAITLSKKGSKQTLQLKPAERAVFIKEYGDGTGEKQAHFIVSENIDTDLYTSWKDERFVFKSEKFGDVLIRLERWYNVNIVLDNSKLYDERVTGAFANESVENALDALKMSMPFTYKINKNKIVIR